MASIGVPNKAAGLAADPEKYTDAGSDKQVETIPSEHHAGMKVNDLTMHRTNLKLVNAPQHGMSAQAWMVATLLQIFALTNQWSLALTGSQAVFIAADLGGADIAGWFGACQLVAASATFPIASHISDHIGRKLTMQMAGIIGIVGGIVAGSATNLGAVLVGLTFLGVACGFGATMWPAVGDIVPVQYRPVVIGYLDIMGGASQASAAVLAGALTSKTRAGWRSNCYLMAGMYAACFVATFWMKFQYTHLEKNKFKGLLKIDWVGALLVTAAMTLTLVGLIGATSHPWGSALVLGPFISGLGLFIPLGIWCYMNENSLLNKTLWLFWNYPFALATAWVSGWLLYGIGSFTPTLLVTYYGASAMRVGVLQLGFNLTFLVFCPPFAASISWFRGHFKPQYGISFLIGMIGAAAMTTIRPPPQDGFMKYVGLSVLLGLGSAGTASMSLAITQLSVIQSNLGVGIGISNASRAFGGALSIAIYFTIFSNRLAANIGPRVAGAAIAAGLPAESVPAFVGALATGNSTALGSIAGVTPEIIQAGTSGLFSAYKTGFDAIFIATAAFLALGAILVACMHRIKRERMDNAVAVNLSGDGRNDDVLVEKV